LPRQSPELPRLGRPGGRLRRVGPASPLAGGGGGRAGLRVSPFDLLDEHCRVRVLIFLDWADPAAK
jgi:hypothetical protein